MIVETKFKYLKVDSFFSSTSGCTDYVKTCKRAADKCPQGKGVIHRVIFDSNELIIADSSRVRTRFQRFFGLNK